MTAPITRVAVIGAGAAGLCATKTLLSTPSSALSPFHVTLYTVIAREEEIAEFQRLRERGFPETYKHCLGDFQWSYMSDIAQRTQCAGLPGHYRQLYNETAALRKKMPLGRYRREVFRIPNESDDEQAQS
jgi:hypothetical protein